MIYHSKTTPRWVKTLSTNLKTTNMRAVTITQIDPNELKDIIEDSMFRVLCKQKHNDIIKLELKIQQLEKLLKTYNNEPKPTNRKLPK
jgi:hypothetical protein